jgi:putative DNA primase/helicase
MTHDFVGEALADVIRLTDAADADTRRTAFVSFPPFTMDPKKGLFITIERRRGKEEWEENVWLSAPFEIIGRVRDPQSHSWARLLRWKDDDGVIHQYPVTDEGLHGDGATLCASLASGGLKITTGSNRVHFASYLNQATIKTRVTVVAHTGWHELGGRKVFVLPADSANSKIIIASATTVSPYTASGTLKEWQDSIGNFAEEHTRAAFVVSVAFMPPLLDLIGESGGGFNLRGASSIGKTSLLCAAASVWSHGGEQGGFIKTWRATANGLEAAAALYSHTLLPLDELSIASGHEVSNIIYSLASGVGKQRAQRDGTARAPKTWRVTILSTGEIGVTTKIQESGKRARAGQEVRIIDVDADAEQGHGVFDHAWPHGSKKLADDLKKAAAASYGVAGPAFVKGIEDMGIESVIGTIRETQEAFRTVIVKDVPTGQVLRVADRFGLAAAAGELAVGLKILPWQAGTATSASKAVFESWYRERGGDDPTEVRTAIEQIRALLERHGDGRFDPAIPDPDARPVVDRLGYAHGAGRDRQWWILPQTWRDVFCAGLDGKMIAKALVRRGLLLPGEDGRTNRLVRIGDKPTRVYILPANAWTEGEDHHGG